MTVFRLLTRFGARSNRAELIGLLLVLTTGFWLVREDSTSVGAVTAAALYFHRLFNPINALLYIFDAVQSTGASLSRRSEEHTSELQSLMRISYAVFCLKNKKTI